MIYRPFVTKAVVAIALLTGCGGSQPPIGAHGAMPQAPANAAHVDHGTSWMLPEAENEDLLYVGGNDGDVTVYSYPKGKLVGTIRNDSFVLPTPDCVDKDGDVFVTDTFRPYIFEYAHGSKKLVATLQTPTAGTSGCSIDPTTGNLAVAVLGAYVAIFPGASGTPTTYTYSGLREYFFCGYDDKGNLYVDGDTYGSYKFAMAELPKGGSGLIGFTITNWGIRFPGGVQWDGKYLAVGDQDVYTIYRLSVSGSSGTKVGAVVLNGGGDITDFWIDGHTVVGANKIQSTGNASFWHYPGGGDAFKTITKGVGGPDGLTISSAPKS